MILRIPGNEEHSQAGGKCHEPVGDNPAGPAVQTNVGYQEFYLRMARDEGSGFLLGRGFQNFVSALSAEYESKHPQHNGIIVKD